MRQHIQIIKTMVCRSPPKGSSTLRGRVKVEACWLMTTRATVNNNLILLWTQETLITARTFLESYLTLKFDIILHSTCYVALSGCYESMINISRSHQYIQRPLFPPPLPFFPICNKNCQFSIPLLQTRTLNRAFISWRIFVIQWMILKIFFKVSEKAEEQQYGQM